MVWIVDHRWCLSVLHCAGGAGLTGLEMKIFGSLEDLGSDDIGPSNVLFDRASLNLAFVDTTSSPSVLINGSGFTLWWPTFGIDAQATASGVVDFSKVPEPSTL